MRSIPLFALKSFGLHHQLYEMAELGFIVVKIDGMGTSNRSKAFHDVCWKNLGDSGFPDRVIWMRRAAAASRDGFGASRYLGRVCWRTECNESFHYAW